jgi:hypothetical protein
MKWITVILFVLLHASAARAQGPTSLPSTLPVRPSVESPKEPAPHVDAFFDFFAKNLRASLFSGFLTLGSFLVAVNTFIVVNLKKEVYDHKFYKDKNSGSATFYGPLRRLSGLLIITILLAVLTAVSQLTIGVLVETTGGAIWCLTMAAITIVFLIIVLVLMWLNLRNWFQQWEEQACKESQPPPTT